MHCPNLTSSRSVPKFATLPSARSLVSFRTMAAQTSTPPSMLALASAACTSGREGSSKLLPLVHSVQRPRCLKVWEEITIPTYANQARYVPRTGQRNPQFLNAKLFNELILTPYREADSNPMPGLSYSSFSSKECRQGSSVHGWMDSSANCRRTFGTRWRSATQDSWDLSTARCLKPMAWRMSTITGAICLR